MDQFNSEGFAKLAGQIANVDQGLNGVEERFLHVEYRMSNLEAKMTGLEERMTGLDGRMVALAGRMETVERDLAVIKSNYVTKADLSDMRTNIVMWAAGVVFFGQLIPFAIKMLAG